MLACLVAQSYAALTGQLHISAQNKAASGTRGGGGGGGGGVLFFFFFFFSLLQSAAHESWGKSSSVRLSRRGDIPPAIACGGICLRSGGGLVVCSIFPHFRSVARNEQSRKPDRSWMVCAAGGGSHEAWTGIDGLMAAYREASWLKPYPWYLAALGSNSELRLGIYES